MRRSALEHAGDRCDEGGHRRPGQDAQARLERVQALDDLEELDSRKIEPNIPKYISSEMTFAAAKPRLRNM